MSSLTTTDRLQGLLPQLFATQKLEGDYYLRFQLTKEIFALIDLSYVQESLIINSDRITAIPNLPEYVLGLMSSRNQVFLALDLAHLAGFTPETINLRQYQTIVIKTNSATNPTESNEINLFGLTVRRVQGISRILPDKFKTVTEEVPDLLLPFVQSSVVQKSDRSFENDRDNSVSLSDRVNHSFLLDIPQLITTRIQSQIQV